MASDSSTSESEWESSEFSEVELDDSEGAFCQLHHPENHNILIRC